MTEIPQGGVIKSTFRSPLGIAHWDRQRMGLRCGRDGTPLQNIIINTTGKQIIIIITTTPHLGAENIVHVIEATSIIVQDIVQTIEKKGNIKITAADMIRNIEEGRR